MTACAHADGIGIWIWNALTCMTYDMGTSSYLDMDAVRLINFIASG